MTKAVATPSEHHAGPFSRLRSSGQQLRSSATQIDLQQAAIAGLRVLGRIGLVYAGLWLTLAGYRKHKRSVLRQFLHDVIPALEKAGATYYLDFGTLLGLYKKGDIMDGDNDCDLVLVEPDFQKLEKELPRLLPKGYVVDWVGKSRPLGDGLEERWLRVYAPTRLMWTDLYGGYWVGDKLRINKGPGLDLHRPMVIPLQRMRVLGQDMNVPANVEQVLCTRYGEDWRVDKYASKGNDETEHNKPYLRVLRALGRVGLKI